jgi:hypothetical protein
VQFTDGSEVLDVRIALKMKAANTIEMSVNLYQTARCNNPEDSHL